MNKQKVAIYARYSTDKQDESSIDGQVKNCKALAKQRGFNVIKIFSDEAMGGDDLQRPGFLALQEALVNQDVDGFLVDDCDRYARNTWSLPKLLSDLVYREQFLLDCAGFDSNDPSAPFVAMIKATIAAEEKRRFPAARIVV